MFRISALLILSFFCFYSFSQSRVPLNRNLNYLFEASVKDTANFHSSIKSAFPGNSADYVNRVIAQPIIDVQAGIDDEKFSYSLLGGFQASAAYKKKLFLNMYISGSWNEFPSFLDSKIDSNNVVPMFGRALYNKDSKYFFLNFSGSLDYVPVKYLTLSLGHDKHFIGDGYRSLLLSDFASPYSYGSLTIEFWRVKYLSMWASLPDIDYSSGNSKFYSKYGSFHFLTVNVTNRLSLGFFESIISWAKDTSTNRGFDLNYLNPVIFYRPVEYSMHSPDNATMGGNLKLRLWKKTYLYGQLFLDDLMIKELISNRGWFGNKYAIQAGFKSYNLFNVPKLFCQTEINYVRPYVYGHSEPLHNYGVRYQTLAHPLGANFEEFLVCARYQKNKWMFSTLLTAVKIGRDTSKTNFGQNIYKSSRLKPKSYGVYLAQGEVQKNLLTSFSVMYKMHDKWDLYFFSTCNLRYSLINGFSHNDSYFTIGFKTLLYNNEIDF